MKKLVTGMFAVAVAFIFTACDGAQQRQPNQTGTQPTTTNGTNERVVANETGEGVVIAGVRWATRNVGETGTFVENPQDPGMLFQWARPTAFPRIRGIDENWDRVSTRDFRATEWYAENDPCPPGWRVPTSQEQLSLVRAGYTLVEDWNNTGVGGAVFGTYPNQIFLPYSARRTGSSMGNHLEERVTNAAGGVTLYWARERGGERATNRASVLRFGTRIPGTGFNNAGAGPGFSAEIRDGLNVRCVADN